MSCKWCPQSQWTLMLRPRICSWHQELHSVGELRWRRPPWSCDILWLWSQDIPRDLALWWAGYIKNQPSTWRMYCCEFVVKISAGALVSSLQFQGGYLELYCECSQHCLSFYTTLPPWAQPPQSLAPNGRLESLSCCMFLTCLGLFVCGIYLFSCFCFWIFLALSIIVGLLVCIILLGATFFFLAFVMGCAILVLVSFWPCLTNNSVWENHVAVGRDNTLSGSLVRSAQNHGGIARASNQIVWSRRVPLHHHHHHHQQLVPHAQPVHSPSWPTFAFPSSSRRLPFICVVSRQHSKCAAGVHWNKL